MFYFNFLVSFYIRNFICAIDSVDDDGKNGLNDLNRLVGRVVQNVSYPSCKERYENFEGVGKYLTAGDDIYENADRSDCRGDGLHLC